MQAKEKITIKEIKYQLKTLGVEELESGLASSFALGSVEEFSLSEEVS